MKSLRTLACLFGVPMFACGSVAQQRIPLDGVWSARSEPLDETNPAPHEIVVPSAFESVFGPSFDGVVRYHRALPLPARRTARVRIEFAAVATEAIVFCNGKEVGRHLGGWTPFRVDVTDALRWDGTDALEVRVDEKVGHNTQGFLPIVQPHFGGIWQSVTMCLDDGPVIDRLAVFLFGDASGRLQFHVPVLGSTARDTSVLLELPDAPGNPVRGTVTDDQPLAGYVTPADVRLWSTVDPHLHTVRLRVFAGETEVDRLERRVGFRTLAADGTRISWNGSPLQVRGVLHWGYSPPHFAPPADREFWRRQLTDFRSLGFNCIKCCLWMPPACVYDLADEIGMLVWQEYPTWHAQIDLPHQQELLTEYGEFFVQDRGHPSTAFRSITCETGHGADFDVVKSLYEACKAAVPQTLVVDDSSWIGWQRITDFWDEHPYGNNSWFPGRLEDFRKHIAEKGKKPLLLGECIAADTWFDRQAWNAKHGEHPAWWRPTCWTAQVEAEAWLSGRFGASTVQSLLPISLDFGMANRKFQVEQLRLRLPDAGYVVSVARDIPKCRMGLYDEHEELKWTADQWAWHADTMLCLDQPWNGRALDGNDAKATVRVSHYGQGALQGELHVWSDALPPDDLRATVSLQPGQTSAPFLLPLRSQPSVLTRVRIRAELTGTHAARNHWDIWQVPASASARGEGVTEVSALTPELLSDIENGARVILHAGDRKGSLRTEAMWFLKGAPFAPDHPFHRLVPRDLLLELSSFDLESGRVMPWDLLQDEVDPILAFWETHDLDLVRFHLHAFDCQLGKGRLLATTLRIDPEQSRQSCHVGHLLRDHLRSGPAPRRALSPATIAGLRASLTEKRLDLPVWRFRTDPMDEGRAAKWQDPKTDVTTVDWRDLKAGSHWENQAEDLRQYTGVAWYRLDFDVPATWRGDDARAVFEGVDDSFEVWLNGELVGTFGDPVAKVTIWLERQVAELAQRLRPGARNTLVLRVVDHSGAGGLWKPAFVTTGPTGPLSRLLH